MKASMIEKMSCCSGLSICSVRNLLFDSSEEICIFESISKRTTLNRKGKELFRSENKERSKTYRAKFWKRRYF